MIMSDMDRNLEAPNKPDNFQPNTQKHLLVQFDLEINSVVRTVQAKNKFGVDGAGLTAAVFDTGLNSNHECFAGRVVPGKNFSADGKGENDTDDVHGHGTNVAGLIAAKGITGSADAREGIATGANIVPVKVLPGNFNAVLRGLEWVLDTAGKTGISVVNLSLGAPGSNYVLDDFAGDQAAKSLQDAVKKLSDMNIPVVFAAGNDYFAFQAEGMSFPSIMRECISVGAVYDAMVGSRAYQSGAIANSTHTDQMTPFSQRLSQELNQQCFTTIFAPGAVATSTGIGSPTAISTQDGTSQAAPTTTGVILLMQQFVLRQSGKLPAVQFIKDCLRSGGVKIFDGDDEDDNVQNTNKTFLRLDAVAALLAAQSRLTLSAIAL
jgi:subtilisin family serine protease